jgi:hypothetical protein
MRLLGQGRQSVYNLNALFGMKLIMSSRYHLFPSGLVVSHPNYDSCTGYHSSSKRRYRNYRATQKSDLSFDYPTGF